MSKTITIRIRRNDQRQLKMLSAYTGRPLWKVVQEMIAREVARTGCPVVSGEVSDDADDTIVPIV